MDITKLDNPRDSSLNKSIKAITNYIISSEYWSSMIDQVYINESSEIELIPTLGSFNIRLGNESSDIETKMAKLDLFYKKTLHLIDYSIYKTIDISYKNQVIGIKKENLNI
jgi:cell division protein FtsQ